MYMQLNQFLLKPNITNFEFNAMELVCSYYTLSVPGGGDPNFFTVLFTKPPASQLPGFVWCDSCKTENNFFLFKK